MTPAEIQQQLIQCTDLLGKSETSYPIRADFLRNWHRTLISARARYLEEEHITEAQWNALTTDELT